MVKLHAVVLLGSFLGHPSGRIYHERVLARSCFLQTNGTPVLAPFKPGREPLTCELHWPLKHFLVPFTFARGSPSPVFANPTLQEDPPCASHLLNRLVSHPAATTAPSSGSLDWGKHENRPRRKLPSPLRAANCFPSPCYFHSRAGERQKGRSCHRGRAGK